MVENAPPKGAGETFIEKRLKRSKAIIDWLVGCQCLVVLSILFLNPEAFTDLNFGLLV